MELLFRVTVTTHDGTLVPRSFGMNGVDGRMGRVCLSPGREGLPFECDVGDDVYGLVG